MTIGNKYRIRCIICFILSYISILSTFAIEYYGWIDNVWWTNHLLRLNKWIPFLYIGIAPTTLLGLILNIVAFILCLKS